MGAIVEYPKTAIKLIKFFGPNVKVLVDGAAFENHRLDIVFLSEYSLTEAIGKLIRVTIANREDAVRLLLQVIDEYNGSPALKPTPLNEI